MIITVTATGALELREPNDFKGFKILEERGAGADTAAALKGVAAVDADGKTAWVSQNALRQWKGQPQPVEWVASFDKMVESVKRFGWVDEDKGAVRAHIEVAG